MIVYKGQGINWHPQSDSLGVSPLKWTRSTHPFISGLCHLVESLRQLTCFIGCFKGRKKEKGDKEGKRRRREMRRKVKKGDDKEGEENALSPSLLIFPTSSLSSSHFPSFFLPLLILSPPFFPSQFPSLPITPPFFSLPSSPPLYSSHPIPSPPIPLTLPPPPPPHPPI